MQKTKEKPPTESSMEVDPAFQKFRYTIYSTGVDSKIAQFNYIEGLKDANFESEEVPYHFTKANLPYIRASKSG